MLGSFFSTLQTIFSLGKIGMGIHANLENQTSIARTKGFYESQVALNQDIASFNQQVAARAGRVSISNAFQQTEQVVSIIKSSYSKRGVEFEGSPKLMTEKAVTMGMQSAFEIAFDTEVQRVNLGLQAESQNRKAAVGIEGLDVAARQNKASLMDMLFNGVDIFGTMMSNSSMNKGSAPVEARKIDMKV
jgi:hypothetical protein